MKIAIVNHDDFSVWLFRRALVQNLLADGHEVHIVCSDGKFVERVTSLGARHRRLDFPRFITPRQDLLAFFNMARLFRAERYDIVHLFQQKIICFGIPAARLAGVPQVFASSTGISTLVEPVPGLRSKVVRFVLGLLYRFSLPWADRVLFQNEDDRAFFFDRGCIRLADTLIVRGSGVDIDAFSPDALDERALAQHSESIKNFDGRVVVTMIARVVFLKGVREFIESSRVIEREAPGRALFLLYGGIEPDTVEALSAEEVRAQEHAGFRWMDWTDTVREALALSDVVVLPSYREGTPRAILEAMAMAKPIVVTDVPGCRNVIEDGRNGFKVPVRDAHALAAAVLRLVEDAELRTRFGRRSYEKAAAEFEENVIADQIIRGLYGLDRKSPGTLGKPRGDVETGADDNRLERLAADPL